MTLQTNPSAGFPAGLRRSPSIDELASMINEDQTELPVIAAGVALRAPDGSILFLKRSDDEENYAGYWSLPGGRTDDGEEPAEACARECFEETGHVITGDLDQVADEVTGTGRGRFVTFENRVADRFTPKFKDGEHVDYVWALPSQPPQPLHPGVAELMKGKYADAAGIGQATDSVLRLAFDRESVRAKDSDGRMRITGANISKATVNPYLGSEIPNAEELGLDPETVYQLLRDPAELEKAAASFNGVQLLRKHIPVSADDHQPYDVVGTTGTEAKFEAPYLRNSLHVWAKDAIDEIESEAKKELSCGYRYRAEMTPGIYDGMRYDGIMRDIVGNHVALVEDGRAGPDVVIGDSNEEIEMADNRELAKKIAAISSRQVSVGALLTYLKPRMALDAKTPIMAKVFEGVTGKNFKEQKPVMAKRLREIAKPKLAKDANLDDVEKVLDMLDGHEIDSGDESVSEPQHNAMEAAAHGNSTLGIPEKVGKEFVSRDNGAPSEEFSSFMKGKGASDEEVKKAWDMFPNKAGATDEAEETDEEKKKKEADMKAAEEDKKAGDKKAMDQAITAAVSASEAKMRKERAEIREAEHAVQPYVGVLPSSLAFDSAEAVYRHVLTMKGVEGVKDIPAAALPHILKVQSKVGAGDHRDETMAHDAASVDGLSKKFPGIERIGLG